MPRIVMKSGPLRKGEKRKGTLYKKKGGLTKTEKKQTKAIVSSALKKEHTLKYFDSDNTQTAAAPNLSTVGTALKQVSVLGYSSTTAKNDQGVTQKYGSQDIIPFFLAKPFREDETETVLRENAPNGNTVAPKVAKASFSFERVRYAVGVGSDATIDDGAARALPITIRMMKVAFKTQVGTAEVLNPNLDLFLDYRTGVPTGIDQAGFDRLQCRYGKINSKKYTKLSDSMFTINQNNIITPANAGASGGSSLPTDQFYGKNGSAIKHMTVPFQLSQRKNGKLYYEDPNGTTTLDTFTSGGQRQLVLIHAWFENGHDLLGATDQPTAPTSEDLQIKHKCCAAFVDTM
ncbi:putative capsid protein [Robaratusivirus semberis]|uniref:Capsid protein n=1 Tax=uncultured virus TaxID=340016 RepID=A0A1I9XGD8_9VIRU|nr:putative capsid protein [uncultured virus]